MRYSDVDLTPLKNHRYRVNRSVTYKDVTVPAGYMTNGADVPRLFWVFIPPNRSDILPAVIFHDYLCELREFHKADRYFGEILDLLRVDRPSRFALVSGVRLYTRAIRPIKEALMHKQRSNAILYEDELLEHFKDANNHYLYQTRDDRTVVCWMPTDFEIVRSAGEGGRIDRGGCGDGICYSLDTQLITIERGN